jgi:hypothetical protein
LSCKERRLFLAVVGFFLQFLFEVDEHVEVAEGGFLEGVVDFLDGLLGGAFFLGLAVVAVGFAVGSVILLRLISVSCIESALLSSASADFIDFLESRFASKLTALWIYAAVSSLSLVSRIS